MLVAVNQTNSEEYICRFSPLLEGDTSVTTVVRFVQREDLSRFSPLLEGDTSVTAGEKLP